MKFNFIVIPVIIIATAYIGTGYTKRGLKDWYKHLNKPKWTPTGQSIGQTWTMIYLLTGFGILWFWNVPAFGILQIIVGAIFLVNAYLNATWNKIFFVEHKIKKAIIWMKYLNGTVILAAIIMFPTSHFAAFLMLPYIIWVAIATNLTKQIQVLNK